MSKNSKEYFGEMLEPFQKKSLDKHRIRLLDLAMEDRGGQVDMMIEVSDEKSEWSRVSSVAAALSLVVDGLVEVVPTNAGLVTITPLGIEYVGELLALNKDELAG